VNCPTPAERAINKEIDKIWKTYDGDDNGALDEREMKRFMRICLNNLGF